MALANDKTLRKSKYQNSVSAWNENRFLSSSEKIKKAIDSMLGIFKHFHPKNHISVFIANCTVWSEGFLYKVAPPELKISPIMYFVIHNSVVLSKILKIVVPFWPLFVYVNYYLNNQFYRVKIDIF